MKKISIYLYTDDGATVNCEVKEPTAENLLTLQMWLNATGCPTAAGAIETSFVTKRNRALPAICGIVNRD